MQRKILGRMHRLLETAKSGLTSIGGACARGEQLASSINRICTAFATVKYVPVPAENRHFQVMALVNANDSGLGD